MLTINNLTVRKLSKFGEINILENLNFEVKKGQSLGVVGESGCGKSIMALTIMRLLPNNMEASGEINLENNILKLSEKEFCKIRGNRIGMIFQEPMNALNPVMSIGSQVSESLKIHKKITNHQAEKEAAKILERVGLPKYKFPLSIFPHQLSGGQRQRVVVAIAIACKPEIIIADEPTTSLDVTIQAQILGLLSEFVFEEKMSLILITHDLGIVAQNTDQMLVMYGGRIVEKGDTQKVFKSLSHPYTKGLFDSIPNVEKIIKQKKSNKSDTSIERFKTIPGRVPEFHERSDGCYFKDRCYSAKQKCSDEFPIEREIGTGHFVSCFYPN